MMMLLFLFGFAFASAAGEITIIVDEPTDNTVKYAVTVVNGTADKTEAAAGERVTITANMPGSGMTFDKWTSDNSVKFSNAESIMTTFVMPNHNVTVTASYKGVGGEGHGHNFPVVGPGGLVEKHSVAVSHGKADKSSAAKGETVTITANEPPADQEFDHWIIILNLNQQFDFEYTNIKFANEYASTTTFVMPEKGVAVEASYKAKTKYTVTVVNGTAEPTTAYEGQTVTITANEPAADEEFDGWTTNDGVNFGNANDVQTSFTMLAHAVTVTATYKAKTVAQPTKYAVTVVNGTADKTEAAAGETVTITANTPADEEEFYGWTTEEDDVDFDDGYSEITTFVMPAHDVTVTATYDESPKPVPPEPLLPPEPFYYTVTVENGSADKTEATAGETVTITADEPADGERFAGWAGEGIEFEDANAAVTTFLMPEDDVTVTANYVDTYAVTVVDGTANMAVAAEGDTVTIIADEPAADEEFDKWVGDGVEFENASAEETSFVMPANAVRVTATYKTKAPQKFAVTVENGVADKATAAKGEIVTITADDRFPSHKLLRWTTSTSGVKFADKLSAETTFVMPARDVTVKATYQVLPKYTVKVTNGTADKAQAYAGETVTITAAAPSAKKQFYNWTCTSGGISFEDTNVVQTTFVMPKKSVWVKANYTAK